MRRGHKKQQKEGGKLCHSINRELVSTFVSWIAAINPARSPVSSPSHPPPSLLLKPKQINDARRDKATSNICTAQALLANMAASYGVYHGPEGVKAIAERIHGMASVTAEALKGAGYGVPTGTFFDTFSGELYWSPRWRIRLSSCSYKFVGTFSCAQVDLRKARERELATLDEQPASSEIAEPYGRYKLKGRTGGDRGTAPTCDTTSPEAGKYKCEEEKKKLPQLTMIMHGK